MIPTDKLREWASREKMQLTDIQLEKLDRYAQLLVDWNQKINLTAITDPEEIALKHFFDSLLLLNFHSILDGASLIDVGTGAGFPSTPLAIVRPDLRITQMDSLNKRVTFLNEVASQLNLSLSTIHSRAEDSARLLELREQFDYATARAVANLRVLSEYCLPYVKPGGYFLAMKSGEIEEELEEAKGAIKELGGKTREVKLYCLPDGSGRSVIVIEKISQTPTKYPRNPNKIKKSPL